MNTESIAPIAGAQRPPPHRRAAPPAPWRWRTLGVAPHRLAFFLGGVLLLASSLWWLHTQWLRLGWLPGWLTTPVAFYPSLVHGTVMSFGFMPLFFAGFLFTAGPKWLGVEPPSVGAVAPALLLQAAGWLLWLLGASLGSAVALAGGGLAVLGLAGSQWRFTRLVLASAAPDRLHATVIALAGWWGVACIGGLLLALAGDRDGLARAFLLSGLWGFVVVVFVAVAHRMIPFFTSSALPMVSVWRPTWVLGFLLLAVAHQLLSVWSDWAGWHSPVWATFSSFWLLVSGLVVLWLAFVWGLVQSLHIRLLAMLHMGFLWLGLALLLDATSHFWALVTGSAPWSVGALHATTMGFLGSLMMAMVTRVSCGHGGRTLVADALVWRLFLLLQLATVTRIAVSLLPLPHPLLVTAVAATLWTLAMAPWVLRLLVWYGKPRADGRPG